MKRPIDADKLIAALQERAWHWREKARDRIVMNDEAKAIARGVEEAIAIVERLARRKTR